MKKTYRYVLLVFLLIVQFKGYSTHLMGGNLTYSFISFNPQSNTYTYNVELRIYRYCAPGSSGLSQQEELAVYNEDPANPNANKVLAGSFIISLVKQSFITPPSPNPNCTVGTSVCVEEGVYQTTITLPASTGGYHLMVERCCRNNNIANLLNPGFTGQTYYAFIPATTNQNNAATFATAPVPFICAGDTTSILNAAFDADGDSLAYSFVVPYRGTSNQNNPTPSPSSFYIWPINTVTYAGGYSFTNPFGAGGYSSINSQTGLTSYYIPNQGFYVIAVEIKEYRNGVLVGITRRDLQLIVIPCPVNTAPSFNVSTITYKTDEGTTLCFTVDALDVDGDSLFLTASGPIFSGSPAASFTPLNGVGSARGQFCWNTGCNQGRSTSYQFTATATDNGCPAKTTNIVYTIFVNPTVISSITGPDSICSSSNTSSNYSVQATAGYTYSWSLKNGTQTSGGNTNSINVQWNGAAGNISVYAMNALGCHSDTVSKSIVTGNPIADAGTDVSICSGESADLGTTSDSSLQYLWSPGTGLSDSTISDPEVTLTNNDTIPYTVQYILTVTQSGCSATDTVYVTVNPQPEVELDSLADVCINQAAFVLSGGSPAGGMYSGHGISNGIFDASVAGVGAHTITYTYSSSGCTDSATATITVNALPNVSIGQIADLCETSDPIQLTSGSPSGGVYSGNGVSNDSFDPSVSGAGVHTITYTYSDSTGCANSDSTTITVYTKPTVSLSVLSDVCEDADPVLLTQGIPSGGIYSGSGVSNGSFNPSDAGVGTHTILYIYTDSNGCSDSASQNITVHALPQVTLGTISDFCLSDSSVFLTTGSPAGGVYAGNGVSNGNFDPSSAGVGSHTIYYTYTDTNGCSNIDSTIVIVHALPLVNLGSFSSVCISANSFALTGGTPIGGTYHGTGVSNGTFDPSVASAGTHDITYIFENQNGCTDSAKSSITVNALPVVTMGTINNMCTSAKPITLNTGSPAGGVYSGNGVLNGVFDPVVVGAGTHAITYLYTDANGCSNSANTTVTVFSTPVVSLSVPSSICVNASAFSLNGGTPAGGTYYGNGVNNGQFNPTVAGIGTHTITYTYSNTNGCADSAHASITVNALPVVSMGAINSLCSTSSPIVLNSGNPSGGVYSGPGVSNGIFNPSVAGAGTHTITYSYTDLSGCSNSASTSVTVYLQPQVGFAPLGSACLNTPPFALTGGSPSGGVYAGNGVSNGMFDASIAGVGTHTITYTFAGQGGCTGSATSTITVNGVPSVSVSVSKGVGCESNTIYIGYGPQSLTITATSSATNPVYSWYKDGALIAGQTANTLQVASAGVYTAVVTDASGCSSSMSNQASIASINVVDVRCGHDLKKVVLCHVPPGNPSNPQTLCIAPSAIPAHLDNHPGDCLGPCPSTRFSSASDIIENLLFSSYPNPFIDQLTIEFTVFENGRLQMDLMDIQGKQIASLFNAETEYDIVYNVTHDGRNLNSGVYLIKVTTENYNVYYKVVKAN